MATAVAMAPTSRLIGLPCLDLWFNLEVSLRRETAASASVAVFELAMCALFFERDELHGRIVAVGPGGASERCDPRASVVQDAVGKVIPHFRPIDGRAGRFSVSRSAPMQPRRS